MQKVSAFLRRKDIVFSPKRYFIDAMSAMAQGLFCTLLVGTILNTLGTQLHIGFLTDIIVTLGKGDGAVAYTIGGLCSAMVGPGMAVAIGQALNAPPMVLFSLIPVGFATNAMGGAGGPLAVLFVAIIASEIGKAVSKETKIDILVTPIVTILCGIGAAALIAPPIGPAARAGHGHRAVAGVVDQAVRLAGRFVRVRDLAEGVVSGVVSVGGLGLRGVRRQCRDHQAHDHGCDQQQGQELACSLLHRYAPFQMLQDA